MTAQNHKGERIAKKIARAGLCSRRDAERWIAAGRVKLNGRVLDTPACLVTDEDEIVVDGKPLKTKAKTRLFRYHKPAGLVTTHKDEKGRPTVFDRLPTFMPRVVSVGRLDLNTEGLLLLTNDGGLSRYLELPATGWTRHYRVRAHGTVTKKKLAYLARGPEIEGIRYKPIKAVLDNQQGQNAWLTVTLSEGKNREIRKVFAALGLQVNRLIRTAYGPFELDNLKSGAAEEVAPETLAAQIPGYASKL